MRTNPELNGKKKQKNDFDDWLVVFYGLSTLEGMPDNGYI